MPGYNPGGGQHAQGGCLRCSRCSIHYPVQQRFHVCDVCEEPTSYFSNVEPDPQWEESVKYAKMQPPATKQADPHVMRFEAYLKMGFDQFQAQALAMAVYGAHGMALYHGTVQQAIDAGCSHALALDVFI